MDSANRAAPSACHRPGAVPALSSACSDEIDAHSSHKLGLLPLPPISGLPEIGTLYAQIEQARSAVGEGWGEGLRFVDDLSSRSCPLTPTLSPLGRGSPPSLRHDPVPTSPERALMGCRLGEQSPCCSASSYHNSRSRKRRHLGWQKSLPDEAGEAKHQRSKFIARASSNTPAQRSSRSRRESCPWRDSKEPCPNS
jgi:hypothetical protein